uniref:Proteasome subunit alpha type n=1 Tax=Timema cristinae TaxID=61476 RepID=A0A7R9CM82_TIMCR|nr:unnamed protein product [Timema cristinae]
MILPSLHLCPIQPSISLTEHTWHQHTTDLDEMPCPTDSPAQMASARLWFLYDLSASQFSPDGRVFQVEYAQKAVENSGTVIALRGKDGVVFAVEKLAVSGLISDSRQIVETARSEASNYRAQYGTNIPLKYLNERVAMYMHAYTLYSAVRPFGCSIILGTYEQDGPVMYMIDPSGVSYGYFGCAVGKAKQAAKTEIEKLKLQDMGCRELVKEAARISTKSEALCTFLRYLWVPF